MILLADETWVFCLGTGTELRKSPRFDGITGGATTLAGARIWDIPTIYP